MFLNHRFKDSLLSQRIQTLYLKAKLQIFISHQKSLNLPKQSSNKLRHNPQSINKFNTTKLFHSHNTEKTFYDNDEDDGNKLILRHSTMNF